jgi:hypothetical protein
MALATERFSKPVSVRLATPYGGEGNDLLLDAKSRQEYRRRVLELRAELAECDQDNDAGKRVRLRNEMECLTDELAAAARHWRRKSQSDPARLSVTKTIRAALAKMADDHPELHRHLVAHIKTGSTCAYVPDPDRRVRWDVIGSS